MRLAGVTVRFPFQVIGPGNSINTENVVTA
jgi:hypothetical protein